MNAFLLFSLLIIPVAVLLGVAYALITAARIKRNPVAIRVFVEVLLRQDHLSLIPILEALVKENYYGRLSEIQIPAIVLVGTKDKTTPSFHAEDLAQGIAGASLRKIKGVGHLINWEAPEEIVSAVKELMEEKVKT